MPGVDEEQPDRVVLDFNLKYTYLRVECGSAMTVAQVNKPPFLLIWGYENHKAFGFPEVFDQD